MSDPTPQQVSNVLAVIENASDADAVDLMAVTCHAAWKWRVLIEAAVMISEEDPNAPTAIWITYENNQ